MNNPPSMLRAIRIANGFWISAVALYCLNHVAFTGTFNVPAPFSNFIDNTLGLLGKIVFLSWIGGLIVEIMSDEDPAPRLHNFRMNLRRGWWIIASIMAAPRLVHFLIFLAVGKEIMPIELIASALNVLCAGWAARQFVRIKYAPIFSGGIKKIPLSPEAVLNGIGFLAASMVLFLLLSVMPIHAGLKPLVEILAYQLNLLMFIFYTDLALKANPEIVEHFRSPKTLILINLSSISAIIDAPVSALLRNYPAFFAVLRALTPPEYRIIEYNRLLWRDRYYRSNSLVAISCYTSNCSDAYTLAKRFRKLGSKVILGGPHVSLLPQEALEFCDSVVVGPAENVWEDIVRDYERNQLRQIYRGGCSPEKLDRIYHYLLQAPVNVISDCLQISRGCKFNCHFCTNAALAGKFRIEKTVNEMVTLVQKVCTEKKSFHFLDNNVYSDPAYTKELLQALVPLKVRWGSNSSIDIAKDDDLLRLLKDSGCAGLLIGFEIPPESPDINWGGKLAFSPDYLRLTQKLKEAGVSVKAQFIFGFPHDSWVSLFRIGWFCMKISPEASAVTLMTPLPGSRFWEESLREGRIFNPNWQAYDLFHLVFDHPRLGRHWLLRKAFPVVTLIIFILTSSWGRRIILLVGAILLGLHLTR